MVIFSSTEMILLGTIEYPLTGASSRDHLEYTSDGWIGLTPRFVYGEALSASVEGACGVSDGKASDLSGEYLSQAPAVKGQITGEKQSGELSPPQDVEAVPDMSERAAHSSARTPVIKVEGSLVSGPSTRPQLHDSHNGSQLSPVERDDPSAPPPSRILPPPRTPSPQRSPDTSTSSPHKRQHSNTPLSPRKRRRSVTSSPRKKQQTNPFPALTPDQQLWGGLLMLQERGLVRVTVDPATLASERLLLQIRAAPHDGRRVSNAQLALLANVFHLVRTPRGYLLPRQSASESLLALYRGIDTPSDPSAYVRGLVGTSDRLDDICAADGGVPGLTSRLYPYQLASVVKMLSREWLPQNTLGPEYNDPLVGGAGPGEAAVYVGEAEPARCVILNGKKPALSARAHGEDPEFAPANESAYDAASTLMTLSASTTPNGSSALGSSASALSNSTPVTSPGEKQSDATFYISVFGMLRRTPPMFREPKGGILAQDMGTGKTVISLAVILASVSDMPSLEGSSTYLDGSLPSPSPQVMTELSLTFPFQASLEEHQRMQPPLPVMPVGYEPYVFEQRDYERQLESVKSQRGASTVHVAFPSLKQLMLDYIRTRGIPYISDGTDEAFPAHLVEELNATVPFYHLYPSSEQRLSREGRRHSLKAQKVYLSTATLIVVPSLLVKHWLDEIDKHVEKSRLTVLVIRLTRDPTPSVDELCTNYNVVLMSLERFADIADAPNHPFHKIHFKRIFVDEGHSLSRQNRVQSLSSNLKIECRWVITGTPSVNLRGSLESAVGGDALLNTEQQSLGNDKEDLTRLASIFAFFLKHPSFSGKRLDRWAALFVRQDSNAHEGIRRVLQNALIRTHPDKVRETYSLPPLTTQIKLLVMNNAERKSYNALLALFAMNSIMTQRTDRDYLFAKENHRWVEELALNLSASTFFFTSSEMVGHLRTAVKLAVERESDPVKSASWSTSDREALRRAIDVVREALDDPKWNFVVSQMTVGLKVRNASLSLLKQYQAHDSTLPLGQLVSLRRDIETVRLGDPDEKRVFYTDGEEFEEELVTLKERENRMTDEEKEEWYDKMQPLTVVHPLPVSGFPKSVEIGPSTSAKLNYVVSQIKKYPDEKFLIFCSSLPDLLFAALSEAFDLHGIKHYVLAGQARKASERGQLASQFNSCTAEECRAILLDAKLGGRGLNFTSASRLICLEPIWVPDLELQAVKRAHRLGQTRPVHFTVLVVQDSYEHFLLKRRFELSNEDKASQAKQPTRDKSLQEVLQSAPYLRTVYEHSEKGFKWTKLVSEQEILKTERKKPPKRRKKTIEPKMVREEKKTPLKKMRARNDSLHAVAF